LKLIELGFKFSSAICPVSQQLRISMLNANYKANYKIIPNVVDTNKFKIGISKITNKHFTFLHVSTLDDSIKNVSGIINAFEKLTHKNITLKIIGDGSTNWIFDKIRNLKTSNTVLVENEKNHHEIAIEMQKANVFVLFSNIENLPLVLIESISCGTPFIATKVGGIPEMFRKDLGRLVDSGNTDQLVEEMNFMIENTNYFDSEEIRSYAVNNYSDKVVGKQFNDLYIEVCS
jgi:glycosyltransferase involved in cell wall biosynthesis